MGTGSGAGKGPAAPASPTESTSSATVSGLGVGVVVVVGRDKAQGKALESSAQPQTLQLQSSTATLRSVDNGSGSPTKGGVARPAPPERQDSTSSVVSSTGSCATASSKTCAAAMKLPASKISCFEVEDTEGIKAYLRILPAPQEDKEYAEPYIQVLNETQVLIRPPREHTNLPLVRNLLSGESGLIFTYGVTNTGKSYTVLGGARKNEAGILPRALDVVFNSIQGRQLEDARIRPRGLVGVEILPPVHSQSDDASSTAEESGSNSSSSANNTTVKSALAAAAAAVNRRNPGRSAEPDEGRESAHVELEHCLELEPRIGLARIGHGHRTAATATRGFQQHITLNRRPLTLKSDPDPRAGGKYVAGLSEHRATSVQEAQALFQRGTENRIEFGTLASRMSSRPHGVFTIKIIREHAGAAAAAAASGGRVEREFYTSRLSIVDLAGSERASNTGLMSGERLKEAGNINKSLMCLGQCLETIRKNQARMASLIPAPVSMAEFPTQATCAASKMMMMKMHALAKAATTALLLLGSSASASALPPLFAQTSTPANGNANANAKVFAHPSHPAHTLRVVEVPSDLCDTTPGVRSFSGYLDVNVDALRKQHGAD
ncbi:hypothetical protein OC844_003417, partial [Tilletia horrida]